MNDISYLKILPWDFDIVEPCVLEVDQIVTEEVEGLFTRFGVQKALVAISPVLQSAQVLIMRQRCLQEVFLILFLLEDRIRMVTRDARITYLCEGREV